MLDTKIQRRDVVSLLVYIDLLTLQRSLIQQRELSPKCTEEDDVQN